MKEHEPPGEGAATGAFVATALVGALVVGALVVGALVVGVWVGAAEKHSLDCMRQYESASVYFEAQSQVPMTRSQFPFADLCWMPMQPVVLLQAAWQFPIGPSTAPVLVQSQMSGFLI